MEEIILIFLAPQPRIGLAPVSRSHADLLEADRQRVLPQGFQVPHRRRAARAEAEGKGRRPEGQFHCSPTAYLATSVHFTSLVSVCLDLFWKHVPAIFENVKP